MFQCIGCPANFNIAPVHWDSTGAIAGFSCPSCAVPHYKADLWPLYGPHNLVFLATTCKCGGAATKLATGIDLCGGCGRIYNFSIPFRNLVCPAPSCKEQVFQPSHCLRVQYFCQTHQPNPPLILASNVCSHNRMMAHDYLQGLLEDWMCIDCQMWFHGKFSDFRPMVGNPFPDYQPISSVGMAAGGIASSAGQPISISGGGFGISLNTGWTIGNVVVGQWIEGSDDWFTASKAADPKKCSRCDIELCKELDACYDKDGDATLCDPCRRGRRPVAVAPEESL